MLGRDKIKLGLRRIGLAAECRRTGDERGLKLGDQSSGLALGQAHGHGPRASEASCGTGDSA